MLNLDQVGGAVQAMVDPEAKRNKMLSIDARVVVYGIKSGSAFFEEIDGEVVSFGMFNEMERCVEIRSIITKETHRGRGLATKICERVISEAQKLDKPIVSLCNSESSNLMRKLGLRLTEKTTGFPELWNECQSCSEHGNWPSCHCQYMQLSGKMHEKRGNRFSVIDLPESNESDLLETAKLYCEVWREPPWLEMEWKLEEVIADFKNCLSKDNGIAMVALKYGKIVGLTSGWNINSEEISQKTNGLFNTRDFDDQVVYYIAELATGKSCRHTGIGKQLSLDLMTRARSNGAERFLLRTNTRALAAKALYSSLGFKETEVVDGKFTDRTYWVL